MWSPEYQNIDGNCLNILKTIQSLLGEFNFTWLKRFLQRESIFFSTHLDGREAGRGGIHGDRPGHVCCCEQL